MKIQNKYSKISLLWLKAIYAWLANNQTKANHEMSSAFEYTKEHLYSNRVHYNKIQ